MRTYSQLTQEQRYQIEAMRAIKRTPAEIARTLGVHRSTIYRELKRNSSLTSYRAHTAHTKTMDRRKEKGRLSRKIQGRLQVIVEAKLRIGWSPEQIAGRLAIEGRASISHETIYQHVLRDYRAGGRLRYCLRFGGYKHHRFRKSRLKRGVRRHIDERPVGADQRLEVGHWERDLVLSRRKGPAILTICDRKSGLVVLRWINSKTMEEVNGATIDALRPFGAYNRTLTNDNGTEFCRPADVEAELRTPVYYTDPAAPWQRGSVENVNGLIRQYFKKSNELVGGHSWIAKAMEETLNLRPRKRLGYRTPHEDFYEEQLSLLNKTLMHVGLEFSNPS